MKKEKGKKKHKKLEEIRNLSIDLINTLNDKS